MLNLDPLRSGSHDATDDAYAAFVHDQMKASTQIGFVVTEACPLHCRHCSVDAPRGRKARSMDRGFATAVAGQLPALRALGIRELAFTGGEPLLASSFLRLTSAAAHGAGIECSVVTSGFWAKDPARARAVARDHHQIRRWNISTDVYHVPQVPVGQVRMAYEALKDQGTNVLIRFTYHDPLSHDDANLIDQIMGFAGHDITFQRLMPAGRARTLPQASADSLSAAARSCGCPSNGPVVRADGAVDPCCSDLYRSKSRHPLLLGNAFEDDLTAIVARWRANPLLQSMRLWGMRCPRQWLKQHNKAFRWQDHTSVCSQCVALMRDPELHRVLEVESRAPDHLGQVARSLEHYFNEPWLADALRRDGAR